LIPVSERARHLFGKNEGAAPAKRKAKPKQLSFSDVLVEIEEEGGWGEKNSPRPGHTVLDRVHQSMILFAAGRTEAIKRFLVTDGAGQDRRFWRLADALCKLYPLGTDERRWVEGVMARKKGLGF
jgi:putative DNA methylase